MKNYVINSHVSGKNVQIQSNLYMCNGHPRDPKFVAVVDRWSLFRGRFMLQRPDLGLHNGGQCIQVVVNSGLLTVRNFCELYLSFESVDVFYHYP